MEEAQDGYLQFFPRPLLADLVTARWLPIVGAGLSRNANIPNSPDEQIPAWEELGEKLSGELTDYKYAGALDSISAYAHEYSRSTLVERLFDLLHIKAAQPGEAHKAFCSIPFSLVCTTNFDFLLEQAYANNSRYCRPLVGEDQLSVWGGNHQNILPNIHSEAIDLLKIHGDLHHPDRMVVTEEDYDTFLDHYPLLSTYLASLLINRTAVLIGYSLDDPDLRKIWQVISDRLGRLRRPAYCIQVGAGRDAVSRFERRGVKVINLPGSRENRSQVLSAAFDELRRFWIAELPSVSQAAQESQQGEFSLPPDEATRLCYMAVEPSLLPFYREEVFPIVQAHGLVPVSMDDISSPYGADAAKSAALMERAAVIVIDLIDSNLYHKLLTMRDRLINIPPTAIVRRNDRITLLKNPEGARVLYRPSDMFDESSEAFLRAFDDWIREASRVLMPRLASAPERLLAKQELDAAVVSSISLLEGTLRELFLDRIPKERSLPLSVLIREAVKEGWLDASTGDIAQKWIRIRNRTLHERTAVTVQEASMVVNGVKDTLTKLIQVAPPASNVPISPKRKGQTEVRRQTVSDEKEDS